MPNWPLMFLLTDPPRVSVLQFIPSARLRFSVGQRAFDFDEVNAGASQAWFVVGVDMRAW